VDAGSTVPFHRPQSRYTVLSWNVWFEGYDQTSDERYREQVWVPRQTALLRELRRADADVLCLQEVTVGQHSFLEMLLREEWIRKDYWVSDLDGSCTFRAWYGVVIASRIPIKKFVVVPFPSSYGRVALMAHFKTMPGTEEMVVGTSHIESLPGSVSLDRVQELQSVQLNLAMRYFDQCSNTGIFAGDLNVSDEDAVEGLRESWGWSDLSGSEPTWFAGGWHPDRIFLRSPAYEGSSRGNSQLFGRTPSGISIAAHDSHVFTPSDHFALLATIVRTAPHGATFSQPLASSTEAVDMSLPLQISQPRWSVRKTQEAVGSDSPSILHAHRNVTSAIEMLNFEMHKFWDECYVYSDQRQQWFKLWKEKGGWWSFDNTMAVPRVEADLIFWRTRVVTEAVKMLNDGAEWDSDVCYVFSEAKNKWFRLWSY
jgi:endonuclease/exonuclease/phosphatase family metal-dependent hydrolase